MPMSKSGAILGREMTSADWEQAAVVQGDVLHLLRSLVKDGVDHRIVAAGASSAVADLIGGINGWPAVPKHFAVMAALTFHLREVG